MRILFSGHTFPSALDLLRRRLPSTDVVTACSSDELRTAPGSADVLVPLMSRIDGRIMDASGCRLIHQFGSGLDGVDLAAAAARGIAVASVPTTGSNAESVAEHIVLLALAVLRRLGDAQASVRNGVLGEPVGTMLAGRTVCLYGLGTIALGVATRLRAFNVRLLGITRDPGAPKVASYRLDACYATADRTAALKETDVLILCARLSYATRGIVDATALAALPKGAILVNAARGRLVDYEALRAALENGRLAGAGLDVFWDEPIAPDDPILALPNVIATPHVAGVTDRSYAEIADFVAANIERFRDGRPLANVSGAAT